MSFWDLEDGTSAKDTGTNFDAGGGNEPIPDKSSVLAAPDQAKWDKDKEGNEYVSIRWSVMKPAEVENRKVFQKIWVTDLEPNTLNRDGEDKAKKKRDKAKKMLAAIDANAGGKLAKMNRMFTDDDLALALIGKAMVVKVGIWEINGNSGDWIMAVSPKGSEIALGADSPRKPSAARNEQTPAGGRRAVSDLDDEIPF